jgi:hypothetical protein
MRPLHGTRCVNYPALADGIRWTLDLVASLAALARTALGCNNYSIHFFFTVYQSIHRLHCVLI